MEFKSNFSGIIFQCFTQLKNYFMTRSWREKFRRNALPLSSIAQQTRYIHPMLVQDRHCALDGGPTLTNIGSNNHHDKKYTTTGGSNLLSGGPRRNWMNRHRMQHLYNSRWLPRVSCDKYKIQPNTVPMWESCVITKWPRNFILMSSSHYKHYEWQLKAFRPWDYGNQIVPNQKMSLPSVISAQSHRSPNLAPTVKPYYDQIKTMEAARVIHIFMPARQAMSYQLNHQMIITRQKRAFIPCWINVRPASETLAQH